MLKNSYWIFLAILIFSVSCQNAEKRSHSGGKKQVTKRPENGFTPSSSGGDFQVAVINDEIKKDDSLQAVVRDVLGKAYPALPQDEAWFEPSFTNAENFSKIQKRHKSVLFLSVIPNDKRTNSLVSDKVFSQQELQDMADTRDVAIKTRWDVMAKPQLVMLITAPTREKLLADIHNHQDEIIEWFDEQEDRSMNDKVYSGGRNTMLTNEMRSSLGYSVNIPQQYDKEKFFEEREANQKVRKAGVYSFGWYSLGTEKTVQNVMTYTVPYDEKYLDKEGIKAIRNQVTKPLVEAAKDEAFMAVEDRYDDVPLIYETESINDQQVHILRGLWRMKNDFMGGPFVTYVIPDKSRNRLVFLDGFVYAAGEDKKPLMKRVETILRSFELPEAQ